MDQHTTPTILITGATGRVGTLLRAAWACDPPTGFVPLWQTRRTAQDGWFRWDMLAEPCPPFSPAPEVIVNFAGVTGAHSDRLWQNTALARAAHCAARQFRCRHLFLMSSAAVYGACTDDTPHDERSPLCPATPYGKAKVAMEHAAQHWPGTTCLRIANILGADSLLSSAQPEILLDPVPTSRAGPIRSWIGPVTFAQILAGLILAALGGQTLPRTLNIAQSPALPMSTLLDAAARPWRYGPAQAGTIANVTLATHRLGRFVSLQAASAPRMIAEARGLLPA